jgi:tetratricopeptide (TPR) repeat protein
MRRGESRVWWLAVGVVAACAGGALGDPITPELRFTLKALVPEAAGGDKGLRGSDDLDRALESFRRQERDRALESLRAACKKNPGLPPAPLMLARLYLAQNQLGAGRAALETAAAEGPDYPGTYLAFGSLALAEGRSTDALVHFEKAATLARAPAWPEAARRYFFIQSHAGVATVAEQRKDWAAARTALAAWLDLEPHHGKGRQRLGQALFHLGKPTDAARELEAAVKDEPALPPAAVTMGWLYMGRGDLDKAGEWMESAVRQAPKDANAHLGLVALMLRRGDPERAKTHADTAGRLAPDAPEVRMARGLVARHLKDPAQAEEYFQAVCRDAPGYFPASNQLALALAEQEDKGKRERALQLAEKNARAYPDSPEALATLGRAFYRLGRLDEAEQALRGAAAGGSFSADTAYFLAVLLVDRGRNDDARSLLRKATEAPMTFAYRKDAAELLDRIAKKMP